MLKRYVKLQVRIDETIADEEFSEIAYIEGTRNGYQWNSFQIRHDQIDELIKKLQEYKKKQHLD